MKRVRTFFKNIIAKFKSNGVTIMAAQIPGSTQYGSVIFIKDPMGFDWKFRVPGEYPTKREAIRAGKGMASLSQEM